MSEVRIDLDDDHVYRVLVCVGPEGRPALLVAGNKAGSVGNAWYEANVPVADQRFDAYLTALRRSKDDTQ